MNCFSRKLLKSLNAALIERRLDPQHKSLKQHATAFVTVQTVQSFDNVIRFEPTPPEPPHTEEEHEEMDTYNDKLKELMKRERN